MCFQFLCDSYDLFCLLQLDKEDEDSEFEDEDDPDFYQLAHMPIQSTDWGSVHRQAILTQVQYTFLSCYVQFGARHCDIIFVFYVI